MRISDWSSDVCSSDLPGGQRNDRQGPILAAQGKHPCQRDNEHRLQEFRWLKTERIASQPPRCAIDRRSNDRHQHQQYRKQNRQKYRSEEHTSELQSLMRISYAVFCLKKKKKNQNSKNKKQN